VPGTVITASFSDAFLAWRTSVPPLTGCLPFD
jgi:hypothetical protein